MPVAVLLAQLVASSAMAAIAWFVQVVHYPLFLLFESMGDSAEARRAYHSENVRRTRPVVLVPMVVEAAAALWIALFPPPGVGLAAALVGLALVAVALLSTILLQVPLHERLGKGTDEPGTVRALVRSTAIRTAAWSLRVVLAAWMLWAFMAARGAA